MLAWLRQRWIVVVSACLNLLAILSLVEALRTSIDVMGVEVVPRNPFVVGRVHAEPPTQFQRENPLAEYRMTQHEKDFVEIKGQIKELRGDFTHITEMLIGALVAVIINLAMTLMAHRRQTRSTNGRGNG